MNNPAYESLLTRRSCRRYLDKPLDEETLNAILTAGTYAPTGSNKQDVLIVLIENPADREAQSDLNHKYGKPGGDAFYGAPHVALVLSDADDPNCRYNGALVMGTLLQAAHTLGAAGCWINRARQSFEDEVGKAMLQKWGIEGNWEGVGYCILGYADGDLPPASPRKEGYIRRV